MWQDATFDLATIDRELGWAAGLGMNTVRVYLHDILFRDDAEGFLDRLDAVLSAAHSHGIAMIPVLFDGVWNPWPKPGVQPEPVPRRHNSVWVQSPGTEILFDETRWESLKPYVQGVVSRFGHDPRVLMWDLFNEPDQVDAVTLRSRSRTHKLAAATRLVDRVFDWAREVEPAQPLTVGVWEYAPDGQPAENSLNALALDRSDVVSFHCYEPGERLRVVIDRLRGQGRPLVCTEWLARSAGSTVDLVQIFADEGVDAINWGLVDGRTQTRFPWTSWVEEVGDDEPWFHELLHADGSPYDEAEAATFRLTAPEQQVGHAARTGHRVEMEAIE
jgi:hypothetical protein